MGSPASSVGPRLAALALCLALSACAAKSVPVVVAQSALGLAQSVGQLQVAAEQLHRAGALSTPQALAVQQRLLSVNGKISNLIPTLRAIDRVQQAGAPVSATEVEAVLTAIVAVSEELSLVVAGVPLAETTRALLDLVRAAQQAVAATLIEIARLRAAIGG